MLQYERAFFKNNSAPFILVLRRVGQGTKLHNRKVKIFTYIRDFRWKCQSDITFLIADTTQFSTFLHFVNRASCNDFW
jgi:hypothetical protein